MAASLDALPFFSTLRVETRRLLAARGIERHLRKGATLFRAGSEPRGIFVVLAGRIRVVRGHRGRQHVIHSEGPGGTLCEVPFFAGGRVPATALAAEPSRCLTLDRHVLLAAMRQDPALAWLLLRRLSIRVRDLVERLDHVLSRGVATRLAGFLLARSQAVSGPLTLGVTQAELAEEIGTVREVVVRCLGQLRRAGIIAPAGRGRYVIHDLAALRALAER